jgi:hypothetical protein
MVRRVAQPERLGAAGTRCLTINVDGVLNIQTTLKPEGKASCCSATQPTGWATLLHHSQPLRFHGFHLIVRFVIILSNDFRYPEKESG